MPPRTQAHRTVRIATPLAEDVLLIKNLAGNERLGRPFQYELVLTSEHHDINYKDVIGQNVTVAIDKAGGEPRFFNGYVSRFAQTRFESALVEYQATVVPWIWFLTRSADCRIFQNLTIPEIIQQVFKDHGFNDFGDQLQGSYPKCDYCVQYRETAFNFVSRLMEQEGIYYYFHHENGKHTLMLCDTVGSHVKFAGYEEQVYRPSTLGTHGEETLWSWVVQHEVQSGTVALNNFDFQNPKKSLLSSSSVDRAHAAANLEMFDYPGPFVDAGEGERYSRLRIEERQAQHETFQGEGDALGICPGFLFSLSGHPRQDLDQEYLTTGANFRIESDALDASGSGGSQPLFEASLTAIVSSQPFRPPRLTAKPMVQGPQTAVVVGPSGEEIYTDKFGRVKVLFHWDRYAKADENASCWVRVSQAWAGKKWGAIYLPRVGQEVIVDFLEGDPDQPIITGRVYNNETMPPYDLPGKATLSTLKSLSSKGGQGFNEIRFEDKKGEEQVFIHGEKNFDTRIKNDAFEWIGNDRHLVVKKDQFEHVENNRDEIVDADHKEKIGKDRHLKVVGKEAKEVGGSHSLTVKGDVIEVFKAKHSEQTTSDYYLKAMNVVIEGMTNVTIKVGGTSIAIEASGIKISAPQVEVEGLAMMELKSPMTTVKGDGMLTLKGGVVMIN